MCTKHRQRKSRAGQIVMPGMVYTHRHTWQAPLRFAGADWTIAAYGAAM
jgi:cytosine/adenosine deaminase-related metal-dependent hydrolase